MITVALTGGIGSGKSTIAEIFKTLNIPVFNSDIKAKNIINTTSSVKKQIIQQFGNESYINNELNKTFIANLIFNSSENLKKINSIVHPVVFEEYLKFQNRNKNKHYTIFESAIIFENNYQNRFDFTISVLSTKSLRIKRLLLRDNASLTAIESRIKNQVSDKVRIENSDFIIRNNNKSLLINQVLKIHNQILNNG